MAGAGGSLFIRERGIPLHDGEIRPCGPSLRSGERGGPPRHGRGRQDAEQRRGHGPPGAEAAGVLQRAPRGHGDVRILRHEH